MIVVVVIIVIVIVVVVIIVVIVLLVVKLNKVQLNFDLNSCTPYPFHSA